MGDREVIRSLESPLNAEGGLAVLRGSLAPDGAIIKQTAASPELLVHTGRAVVFEDHDDMERRIDDPDLDVHPEDVLVMRNAGPVGGPGMPEWGLLPLPRRLLERGVKDMVRISDARMSGTALGTVVVHVTPESGLADRLPRSGTAIPSRWTSQAGGSTSLWTKTRSSVGLRTAHVSTRPPAGGTAGSIPGTSCRPTRAATSTS